MRDSMNGGDNVFVYLYDSGARFFNPPFLDKMGIIFKDDGAFYDVTTWD